MTPPSKKFPNDMDKAKTIKRNSNDGKVKQRIKMDIVANLPIEIAQQILMQLPPDDAINAWRSNLRWKMIMNDNYFWEMKCANDKYYERREGKQSSIYTSLVDRFCYWQGVYMYNHRIERNWKNHNFKRLNIQHVNQYHRIHYFDDHLLIASTSRNIIRFIDSTTGKIQLWVSCWDEGRFLKVIRKGHFLLAHSTTNCLKVWSTDSKIVLLNMELNTKVLVVEMCNHLLLVGCENGKFSVLDINLGLVIYEQDDSPVNCVANCEDSIFTGMSNGTVNVLKYCVSSSVLSKISSFVCCCSKAILKIGIVHNREYLIIFADDGTICTWDRLTLTKLKSIIVHPSIPPFVIYGDQFLCVGRNGISLEVYSFITGSRILCIDNQVPITFLRTNGSQVITCSAVDNSIKMWCLNTGKFKAHIRLGVDVDNVKGLFFTKTKLAYFGSINVAFPTNVLCIRNYEL